MNNILLTNFLINEIRDIFNFHNGDKDFLKECVLSNMDHQYNGYDLKEFPYYLNLYDLYRITFHQNPNLYLPGYKYNSERYFDLLLRSLSIDFLETNILNLNKGIKIDSKEDIETVVKFLDNISNKENFEIFNIGPTRSDLLDGFICPFTLHWNYFIYIIGFIRYRLKNLKQESRTYSLDFINSSIEIGVDGLLNYIGKDKMYTPIKNYYKRFFYVFFNNDYIYIEHLSKGDTLSSISFLDNLLDKEKCRQFLFNSNFYFIND